MDSYLKTHESVSTFKFDLKKILKYFIVSIKF